MKTNTSDSSAVQITGEYYQEMPQSQTTDQHTEARGRDAEYSQSHDSKNCVTSKKVFIPFATSKCSTCAVALASSLFAQVKYGCRYMF